MKPTYADHCESYELRISKEDRTCWTWQERDGADEPQCSRMVGRGETYMRSTIFPGHESGYADGGWRPKITWVDNKIVWIQEPVKPAPVVSIFCLPCCERWGNLGRALAWITDHREAMAS